MTSKSSGSYFLFYADISEVRKAKDEMFTYIMLALYISIIYSISSEVTFLSRKLNTTPSSIYFNISD